MHVWTGGGNRNKTGQILKQDGELLDELHNSFLLCMYEYFHNKSFKNVWLSIQLYIPVTWGITYH